MHVRISNSQAEFYVQAASEAWGAQGATTAFILVDGQLAALLAVRDMPRPSAFEAVLQLRGKAVTCAMLTGAHFRIVVLCSCSLYKVFHLAVETCRIVHRTQNSIQTSCACHVRVTAHVVGQRPGVDTHTARPTFKANRPRSNSNMVHAGDTRTTAHVVGRQLGLDPCNVHAELLPAHKLQLVGAYKAGAGAAADEGGSW